MLLSPGLTHTGAVVMLERIHLLQEIENMKFNSIEKQVKEKRGVWLILEILRLAGTF